MLAAFDQWEILIIPAIGIVVWVVSVLFRNATEPPKKNNPRPGGREAEEPRRQTSSDLDRFIADTRRQREMEERRMQRPSSPPSRQRRPVILEEVEDEPRPRPTPRPPVLQPMAPRPTVLQPMAPRPVTRQVPVARAVVPVLEPVELVSSAPVMQSLTQVALPDVPDLPTAPVDMLKRDVAAVSPLLLDIKEMLRSPKSAQLAFALREILDAPLCRRRRT